MKYMIFIVGLFFVFSSFAETFKPMNVENFTGSYDGSIGNANALMWQLPDEPGQSNISFQVYKETDQFRLVSHRGEEIFDEVPSFIFDLKKVDWTNFSTTTSGSKAEISLLELKGEDSKQKVNLGDLNASCAGSISEGDFFKQLLEVCTQDGALSFKELLTAELGRGGSEWRKFWNQILKGTQKANSNSVVLENLNVSVNRGKLNLKVKADVDVKVTVKAEGYIEYKNNEIVLRLDKVKASFLTITDKVFDELEKLQTPYVVVKRPFVTISLP